VERPKLSYLALAASGGAVLVALIVLVIKVRAAPSAPELAPGELARAASTGAAAAFRTPSAAPPREEPLAAEPPQPPPRAPRQPAAPEPALPDAPQPAEPAAPARTEDLDEVIAVATEYYDRGDYENARSTVAAALESGSGSSKADKLLRIAASASCFLGDVETARGYYERLSARSQRQIQRRCERLGIEF